MNPKLGPMLATLASFSRKFELTISISYGLIAEQPWSV